MNADDRARLAQPVAKPATEAATEAATAALTDAAIEAVRAASREGRLATLAEVLAALAADGPLGQPGGQAQCRPEGQAQCRPGDQPEGRAEADNARPAQAGVEPGKAHEAVHEAVHEESPLADPASRQTGVPAGVLAGILASQPGLASFPGLSGQTLYHAPDLLSHTYARILDRKGSPLALLAEEIRANSRDYPRPVPVELFEAPPFELTPEEIEHALRAMAADPAHQDITFTTTSTGAVYLFSTRHLERGYAAFLAQRAESLSVNP